MSRIRTVEILRPGPPGDLTQTVADTRYADKDRVDPGSSGSTGQALARGVSGPIWVDHVLNVKAFGAVGDSSTDDTTAVQAALDAAYSASQDLYYAVLFPRGDYRVADLEVKADKKVLFVGAEGAKGTRLRYNGDGAAGSTIVTWTERANFGGMVGLTLNGGNPDNNEMAEHLVVLDYADLPCTWHDLAFQACYGDGVSLQSGVVNNWHLDRIRFDNVGGWGIAIEPTGTHERRIFSMTRWTWDNNLGGETQTIATTAGHYDGTHWGKGVLSVTNGKGIMFGFAHARIETNKRLIVPSGGEQPAYFKDGATSSSGGIWTFGPDFLGYAAEADGASMLQISHPNIGLTIMPGCGIERTQILEHTSDATTEGNNIGRNRYGAMVVRGPSQLSAQGVQINSQLVDSRDSKPGGSNFSEYRPGDIVLNRDPTPGSEGTGWIVTGPDGTTIPAGATIATTAAITSSSDQVDMSGNANKLHEMVPGRAITLQGAGPASANLDTTILARDVATMTVTVADAASTSVNPLTIIWRQPEFREFGDIITYGTSAPASGTFARGEKRWNTQPSELGSSPNKYVITGWICVTAGSPGTWVPMRALTGN